MAGITKFIDKAKRSHDESRGRHFEKLIKGKSKEEIRKIEQALLKPKPIDSYKGPKSGKSVFDKKSITITFPNGEYIKKLGKFMRVNTYMKNNTYDTGFLIELIELMEQGRLRWNKRQGCFYFKERVGRRIRL